MGLKSLSPSLNASGAEGVPLGSPFSMNAVGALSPPSSTSGYASGAPSGTSTPVSKSPQTKKKKSEIREGEKEDTS
jgi:hypothetical protein